MSGASFFDEIMEWHEVAREFNWQPAWDYSLRKEVFEDYVKELVKFPEKLLVYDGEIHADPSFTGFTRATLEASLENAIDTVADYFFILRGRIIYSQRRENFSNGETYLYKGFYNEGFTLSKIYSGGLGDRLVEIKRVNRFAIDDLNITFKRDSPFSSYLYVGNGSKRYFYFALDKSYSDSLNEGVFKDFDGFYDFFRGFYVMMDGDFKKENLRFREAIKLLRSVGKKSK